MAQTILRIIRLSILRLKLETSPERIVLSDTTNNKTLNSEIETVRVAAFSVHDKVSTNNKTLNSEIETNLFAVSQRQYPSYE